MFQRTIRIASGRVIALLSIVLGILPILPLAGVDIGSLIAHQDLICLIGSAGLGLTSVLLGCRWGWMGLGLAIVQLGMDAVYAILSSAQNI